GLDVLQNAVIGGNAELVRLLISQYHANVESSDNIGRRPIHHACLTGHLEVFEALIELGANFNVVDKWDNWTALHYAAKENRLAIVKRLVELGSDYRLKDKNGRAPMDL
ncbi:ankyrin, partial [Basidiobolus meristosporus CBS 931.73]